MFNENDVGSSDCNEDVVTLFQTSLDVDAFSIAAAKSRVSRQFTAIAEYIAAVVAAHATHTVA